MHSFSDNHFQPTALHFIPTAPSVYSQSRSSNTRLVQQQQQQQQQHQVVTTPTPPPTTTPPIIYSPVQDNARDQLNMSRIDQVLCYSKWYQIIITVININLWLIVTLTLNPLFLFESLVSLQFVFNIFVMMYC